MCSTFLANLLFAIGTASMRVLADDRGEVPDANTVMNGLGSNPNIDAIVTPVMGIFGSVYDLVLVLGIALLVLTVVLVAIGLATAGGNGGKREESKTQLLFAFAAAAGIGAVVSLATAILKLGASI